jgi:disulfide bond formation protein DsbB
MRRPYIAFACFVAGLLLILLIELPIARIVGVPLMFAGIALGVAAIASPDFLERDHGSGRGEK